MLFVLSVSQRPRPHFYGSHILCVGGTTRASNMRPTQDDSTHMWILLVHYRRPATFCRHLQIFILQLQINLFGIYS